MDLQLQVKYSTIIVRDMAESVKFFTEVMGFVLDSHYELGHGATINLMRGDGETLVELIESDQFPVGFYSVGMAVQDMDAAMAELKTRGAKVLAEPQPTTDGSCVFLEDPNGVRIALVCHGQKRELGI